MSSDIIVVGDVRGSTGADPVAKTTHSASWSLPCCSGEVVVIVQHLLDDAFESVLAVPFDILTSLSRVRMISCVKKETRSAA